MACIFQCFQSLVIQTRISFKMRISFKVLSIALALAFASSKITAQNAVTVDVNNVLNDVSNKPLGINTNYLMDGSYISPAPSTSTTSALQGMGVNFLRYPGGEKADNYLWSAPPWSGPSPRFARPGSCEWPSNDTRFAQSNYSTAKPEVLDFDEFMTMCQAVGGTPLIVVAYDAMYKPASCGPIPTKEQLLDNAEEWVRYANVVKGYNIKYWMIGNESYHSGSYNGIATPSQYRDDVIEFAQRMKAVDPTIKIIANGDGNAWWSTVLPSAAPYIDYLGVSNYPVWNYSGGYTYYKNNTPDFMATVTNAINAINSYAPPADKSRIKVITTEFSSKDWANGWQDANDLGHALASFEILGQHLKNPKVEAALFWNTRWVNNTTNPHDVFDALKSNGSLQPGGMAMSIWGNNLLDKMVGATSTTKVRSFASYRASSGELNIFLINKETTSQVTNVTLNNYLPGATGSRWELKGSGPSDTSPTWTQASPVSAPGGNLSLTLPPNSVTLIKLAPRTVLPVTVVDFSLVSYLKKVKITWRTASETNNQGFTIERSADGIQYSPIGVVPGAGNSNKEISYAFTDNDPREGVTYYRLKQTDHDGRYTYSAVQSVSIADLSSAFKVYPNPANEEVKIEFIPGDLVTVTLKAFTVDGKECYSKECDATKGQIKLRVSEWPNGMYFLRLYCGEDTYVEKLVVE